jgi:universal stress protein E
MALNKIMVVIDPTEDQQPAFERALDSARLTGATLHLYLCVNEESGHASLDDATAALQPGLDALAARARDEGVDTSSELEWAVDWRRQAVIAAARCSASMVFKRSFDHSQVQREIRQTADWTLLRTSPCPVLLVKNFHDWQHRRVLAAINPETTDEAHIRLNHQIISFAGRFTDAYGTDAHFVAAFHDLIHLTHGKAADVIRDTALELDVDLIIVGTVGRDGIKGRVVGNTSERLLDQTHSDLLVLN